MALTRGGIRHKFSPLASPKLDQAETDWPVMKMFAGLMSDE